MSRNSIPNDDNRGIKNYAVITMAYWGFTLTDGAIRMLVVLYFYQLGYTPLTIASLFLFYEFFGIVTNLFGGWLGARFGLNSTLYSGMLLQVFALLMLTVPDQYLSVVYVMAAQALSGIAKDLNKMSAKASVKLLVPDQQDNSQQRLFKWIAILTGSKNTLKGAGYFLGGLLLSLFEFRGALQILATGLFLVFVISVLLLPSKLGKTVKKAKFTQVFSRSPDVNGLSLARFFLFASRDVWFVVALPLYLMAQLNWSAAEVGGFLAAWIIIYGLIQAFTPTMIRGLHGGRGPGTANALQFIVILLLVPLAIAYGLFTGLDPALVLMTGLGFFAFVFAINSSLHSYLIVAWSKHDKVAMNVGFYYMANAAGRLLGTVISGWAYQQYDLTGCLIVSAAFIALAAAATFKLNHSQKRLSRTD